MKPAPAKLIDQTTAEELGRATLQIVHDLKNQLNGLKLYATFLRKRLDTRENSSEEHEIIAKLIGGLDLAAGEMTALVRFAKPLEVRLLPNSDLQKILLSVAEAPNRDSGGLELPSIALHFEDTPMQGDFDGDLLIEAFNGITTDLRKSVSGKEGQTISLHVHREDDQAVCEWRGGKLKTRYQAISERNGCGTIHLAVAAKIIEAHGGDLKCEADVVRSWLPLTSQS